MRKLLFSLIAAFFTFSANPNIARAVPDSFAGLTAKLIPSVVNISTTQKFKQKVPEFSENLPFEDLPPGHPFEEFQDFFDRFRERFGDEDGVIERHAMSLGSGFVISPDGLIVTNYHVIADAEEIHINFLDNTKYEAEIIGKDPKTDLALLKIESDKKLPYVKFGNSDQAKVGDWIVAIGNPFGLGGTVTAGIISARARDINAGPFDDFIQTDAAINRGNSGGPMFNMEGQVIGINTAIFSPSGGNVGIGFAVPANLAQPIIEQLQKNGKIERGWLGVKIQTVTEEIAESLGLDETIGALVVEVSKNSPADKAGIKSGDIIVEYNGNKIEYMKQLPRLVAETKIGSKVQITVWRNGSKKVLQVRTGELQEEDVRPKRSEESGDNGDNSTKEILGIKLTPLDSALRNRYGIEDRISGLVVLDARKAAKKLAAILRPGDIILQANQKNMATLDDLEAAIKEIKSQGRDAILLQMYRKGEILFIASPIE